MGFYPVAVYYSKTQHTNNTPHSNKHNTQSYTNNKGHTTHNEQDEASEVGYIFVCKWTGYKQIYTLLGFAFVYSLFN
jgi:hypothetical protein